MAFVLVMTRTPAFPALFDGIPVMPALFDGIPVMPDLIGHLLGPVQFHKVDFYHFQPSDRSRWSKLMAEVLVLDAGDVQLLAEGIEGKPNYPWR